MNKGCNNCKHYTGEYIPKFGIVPDGHFFMGGNSFGRCANGKNAACVQWWIFNGGKVIPEELEDMPCFEPHELHVALSKMADKADEILKKLKP